MDQVWRPIVKGVCVTVILSSVGLNFQQGEWWAAMVALNVAFNL